jgi:hypothetical protein
MRAVSEELLARLGVEATITVAADVDPAEVITPRPSAEPRVARAWIDLSRPDRATLYLVDREWERVLVRHLRRTPGHDELAREAIGHILETAVDALLHGARIGVVREDAQNELEGPFSPAVPGAVAKAAPAVSPKGERAIRLHVQGGADYEAALYGDRGIVAHGPAAMLFVAAGDRPLRPALWLSVQYRVPVRVDAQPLGVRLDGAAARALAALDATLNPRVAMRFGAGAGVEIVHMSPLAEPGSGASPAADQDFATVVARSSIALRFSVSQHVAMAATLSCDLDLSGTRYVTVVNGAAVPALSPWTLRPALALGVDVE